MSNLYQKIEAAKKRVRSSSILAASNWQEDVINLANLGYSDQIIDSVNALIESFAKKFKIHSVNAASSNEWSLFIEVELDAGKELDGAYGVPAYNHDHLRTAAEIASSADSQFDVQFCAGDSKYLTAVIIAANPNEG